MLDVSNRASQAINTLTSTAGHSGHGGLRISTTGKSAQGVDFALEVTDRPVVGDHVVLGDLGSRVFLDRTAARRLDDLVLDVQGDDDGKFRLTVHHKS